eukprot:TRINITY_DN71229_c0_g1_i1.p1 TRINITY_DN71229_c0_g1~~TRINITY_DN71229_c0_g1_i1.p1  ORF type:complete len:501 (+),score=150.59 TRINITY_DN71229_c0_g1_i1:59-1504(+)
MAAGGGARGGLFSEGGRFSEGVDAAMQAFNNSLPYDKRLWAQDLRGSKAYSEGIERLGIITPAEGAQMREGLDAVGARWADGSFAAQPADEDIHTANERVLGEIVGKEVSGKLHTGRSRNDQVAVDMRMWLRDEIDRISELLKGLIEATAARAEREVDLILPGYTHLQRAQPVRWSHWLLSFCWMWARDLDRLRSLRDARYGLALCNLGASALAGNPFGIDRSLLAERLGFSGASWNSLDDTSNRDFVAEFLFVCSLLLVHCTRIAEDLCIYCSAEFGFVTLADRYSTGSSLMPQKKNPDSMELLRGKAGRVVGGLQCMLMNMKGLPSTYNKDLQEDKEPMFDAADTVRLCLTVLTGVIETLTVKPDRMKAALSYDLLATDVADYLVRKGLPFRETHHIVGRLVRIAEERKVSIAEVPLSELKQLSGAFDEDIKAVWSFEQSVERRTVQGGTARAAVLAQVAELRSGVLRPEGPAKRPRLG